MSPHHYQIDMLCRGGLEDLITSVTFADQFARVLHIGNSRPVKLMAFIDAIEKATGKPLQKNMLPFQLGDVQATYANVTELSNDLGYQPATDIDHGIGEFVRWYLEFYKP